VVLNTQSDRTAVTPAIANARLNNLTGMLLSILTIIWCSRTYACVEADESAAAAD
jgi:hypothetical protein